MTKGKNQYIIRNQVGLAVKGADNVKAIRLTITQAESIKVGKVITSNQGAELLVHSESCLISEKNKLWKR